MKKFKFNKLVRDKVIENMLDNNDQAPDWYELDDQAFVTELKKKLLEETNEFINESDDGQIIEELADIQEIINNLLKAYKLSKEDLEKARIEKLRKNGGFNKKVFIKTIEISENSKWIDYYKEQRDKYPEIKD